jgi:hypothetical protein
MGINRCLHTSADIKGLFFRYPGKVVETRAFGKEKPLVMLDIYWDLAVSFCMPLHGKGLFGLQQSQKKSPPLRW